MCVAHEEQGNNVGREGGKRASLPKFSTISSHIIELHCIKLHMDLLALISIVIFAICLLYGNCNDDFIVFL